MRDTGEALQVFVVSIVPKIEQPEGPEERDRRVLSRFDGEVERIHGALEEHLSSRVPLVEEIARYSMLGAGKRLRPLLFVLSARLCGGRGENLYRYAVIFEAIHAASLLHDDVLDNAEFRRKKPSASRVWGNHAAVLGGDFLYSRSFSLAVECGSRPFMEALTRTTTRMAEGQMLELTHTNNWSLTRDEYMEIIAAKTAVLISAACACGSIIAGAGDRESDALGRFGLSLGTAFQLIDDLLDYTATQEVVGKPVGKDLREGKITLPLIRTLDLIGKDEALLLQERFRNGNPSEEDYDRVIRRVRGSGSLEEIQQEARSHVLQAEDALNAFPDSPVRRDLLTLNRHLLTRSF